MPFNFKPPTLLGSLVCVFVAIIGFMLIACEGPQGPQGERGPEGPAGTGPTITIGDNGNWFINGVDTGNPSQGAPGTPGTAIYIGPHDTWVVGGVDTNIPVTGPQGPAGVPGIAGPPGPNGERGSVVTVCKETGNWLIDGVDTEVSARGQEGAPGSVVTIGGNGNWFIDDVDTGFSATLIPRPVTDIAVYPASLSMAVGASYTLTAALTPVNATNRNVVWFIVSPAERQIVAVDMFSGEITALSVGTATIIVASLYNPSLRATSTITVGIQCDYSGSYPCSCEDIAAVVELVRTNPRSLEKRLNNNVSVRSSSGGFQITFNFSNVTKDDNGVYEVPFSIICTTSTRSRIDILHWEPQESEAGVILNFDDWYPSWREHHDIFERTGVLTTLFFARYADPRLDDAIFFAEHGHEIGWHTATHPNLANLDPSRPEDLARFDWETVGSISNLVRDSDIQIFNFAYPFGANRPWMHERLEQRFHIHRGFTHPRWQPLPIYTAARLRKGGFINSMSVDINQFNGSHDFREHIVRIFLITKFMGGVIPVSSHVITDSGIDWSISPMDLEYLITVGKGLRLNFYRFKDFID